MESKFRHGGEKNLIRNKVIEVRRKTTELCRKTTMAICSGCNHESYRPFKNFAK